MILLLDNYDSFTYNLVDYFAQLGVACDVIRNSEPVNEIVDKEYSGLIISPGPEEPQKAGILMEILDHYMGEIPILGICLGHQAIGQYFGASLMKAKVPMHGKVSQINCEEHALYKNVPNNHEVVRYNSLILTDVVSPLSVIASTAEGEVMAITHNKLPVWGVQYHPEAALSEYGLKTLNNWVEAINH